jgi:hypothetical protein
MLTRQLSACSDIESMAEPVFNGQPRDYRCEPFEFGILCVMPVLLMTAVYKRTQSSANC